MIPFFNQTDSKILFEKVLKEWTKKVQIKLDHFIKNDYWSEIHYF